MGPISNRYTRLVGIEHPIVQEGLGPYRTSKLAAAVSQAGGLGTVSMPGMPEDLREGARTFRAHIDECASLTDKPFAVNIPVGVDAHGQVVEFTDVYIRAVLDARRADSALAAQLTVLTTSAGFPGAYVGMIKDAGLGPPAQGGLDPPGREGRRRRRRRRHCGRLRDGRPRARGGSAHVRARPAGDRERGRPRRADRRRSRRTDAGRSLCMGADAVALGTRFILAEENSDWHPAYLQALLDAKEGDDVAFNGVYGPCRGLRNAASEELLVAQSDPDADPVELIRHKIASMARAQTEGDVEHSLVMTGQVAGAIDDVIRVAEFIPNMAEEAAKVLEGLTANLHR
jgi:enoyl-[acyl-carrier protein] reductase II